MLFGIWWEILCTMLAFAGATVEATAHRWMIQGGANAQAAASSKLEKTESRSKLLL